KETVHDPRLQVELEQTLLGLKGAVRDLRAMINDLRPPSLIRFGLAKALQFYLEDFREKHPEILLETDLMEDGSCLSEPERLSLFRIVQESLTNAAKHANATHMKVSLTCDVDRTVLNIYDNGNGFEISNNLVDYTLKGHFGLVGMKERAEAIGGTFSLLTAPGEGTSIQVSVMVPEEVKL
ncbi:MAG: histidine kinase, partial [Chloroflexi bacterium]